MSVQNVRNLLNMEFHGGDCHQLKTELTVSLNGPVSLGEGSAKWEIGKGKLLGDRE